MDTLTDRLNNLNPPQKKAVETIEGPVMVVAGPGSGKTEILSLRVATILSETDAAPGNILCLTFTDAAAQNMRERLRGLIGHDAYKVSIHTFHSLGVDIIERHPEHFYGGARFTPADDLARIEILEEILKGLPHSNPLRSELPGGGFVYIRDLMTAIGDLKKAGLTPDALEEIIHANTQSAKQFLEEFDKLFSSRISQKSVPEARKIAQALIEKGDSVLYHTFPSWERAVGESLMRAVLEAEEVGKATPLSAWKTKFTEKRADGTRTHRDVRAEDKMYSLAVIYRDYRMALTSRELFDFDDMILDTITALEAHSELLADLQEEFQYVLVDEFQDTNDAQMRLLELIGSASVHEGRPNIMVVGDDDQAVYKFQGALLSNILEFPKRYRETSVITMTDNYRSTQAVLNVARQVIICGSDRLEGHMTGVDKTLSSRNTTIQDGIIEHRVSRSSLAELQGVARAIEADIARGVPPEEIAVIARTHAALKSLIPTLSLLKIPVSYERQSNVLDEPHIEQLITMATYVSSLAGKRDDDADDLLPEILSYPFFAVPRDVLWQLSVDAAQTGESRKRWIGLMRSHKDKRIREVAELLDACSRLARTAPLEIVLDALVGAPIHNAPDDENDDGSLEQDINSHSPYGPIPRSPFREYYFGTDEFTSHREQYLAFLSGLRVLVNSLRTFRSGEKLTVDHLMTFVNMHRENELPLYDRSPFVSAKKSVQLLTAHKAKGLEFDTVYVIRCMDKEWASSRNQKKIRFPSNLPIAAAGDTIDDQRKLFFVTLTRAKRNLILTSHEVADDMKPLPPLRFLEDVAEGISLANDQESDGVEQNIEILESWREGLTATPYSQDEEAILHHQLETYTMSVTHLNNFLDVSLGGPRTFLESNLLRFPQPMSKAASFGDAMHRSVEWLYSKLRELGTVPKLSSVLERFERELDRKRLDMHDHKYLLGKGKEHLETYYHARKSFFNAAHGIEVNFAHEGVVVGDALITGKIDRLEYDEGGGSFRVIDLKTGKPTTSWNSGNASHEKVKLYKYARQLQFYKILVEGSKRYGDKGKVDLGAVEFLQPLDDGSIAVLEYTYRDEDLDRTRALIDSVFRKIQALDLPETSGYSPDLAGMINFEDDLLDGKL